MRIVGITGPIGHGKTSFGNALQKLETKAVHYESHQIIGGLMEAWLASVPQLPAPNDLTGMNNWLKKLVPLLNRTFGVSCEFDQIKLKAVKIAQHPESYQKLFDFLAQPPTSETTITEANKTYFRPLLQWMGGYFLTTVDPGLWYKQILSLIQKDKAVGIDLATVGGLRFPEDAVILKRAGGVIVGISRPGQAERDLSDPTERQRQSIPVDVRIENNGSLADLDRCAAHFYSDLKAGQLKTIYHAV